MVSDTENWFSLDCMFNSCFLKYNNSNRLRVLLMPMPVLSCLPIALAA